MSERHLSAEERERWWRQNRDRYREIDHEDPVARGQVFRETYPKRKRLAFGLPPLNRKHRRK